MRQHTLIRHGHKIVSTYHDEVGEQIHTIYSLSAENDEAVKSLAFHDNELSRQIKGGRSVSWDPVAEFTSQAQAIKAAKLRLLFSELSEEERQELFRVVYPLVNHDNTVTPVEE